MGALVCAIYLGLVQTLIAGGIFYLAAPAVIARGCAGEPTASPPAPGRVVLARLDCCKPERLVLYFIPKRYA